MPGSKCLVWICSISKPFLIGKAAQANVMRYLS